MSLSAALYDLNEPPGPLSVERQPEMKLKVLTTV